MSLLNLVWRIISIPRFVINWIFTNQKISELEKEEGEVLSIVDAIKNNTLPGSNFDYATELTEMALIGVLAQRFGTRLEYNAEKMEITNRPDLNIYLKEPYRKGWGYGENLWK